MLTIVVLGVFLFYTDWTIALSAMILAIVFGFKKWMKNAGRNMRSAGVLKSQYEYQTIKGITREPSLSINVIGYIIRLGF